MSVVRYPYHPPHPKLPASAAGSLQGGEWVIIQALTRPDLSVTCIMDEGGARQTGGGLWDKFERPRDVGIVEYRGRQLVTQRLPIVIDGFAYSLTWGLRFIDSYVNLIEEIADRGLPLRLIGPVLKAERKWVIEDIEYGNAIRGINYGRRLRQHLVLNLLEYVVGEQLEKLPKSKAQPRSFRWYRIRQGDDLQKVASNELGRASRWQEIAALNPPMRDVKFVSRQWPVGNLIKIPKE